MAVVWFSLCRLDWEMSQFSEQELKALAAWRGFSDKHLKGLKIQEFRNTYPHRINERSTYRQK